MDILSPGVCGCRAIGIVRTDKKYDILKVGSAFVKSMNYVTEHAICNLAVTEIECVYRAVRAECLI